MGQAKQRGSQVARVQEAKAKINALKPATIICNSCQKETTDIQALDTRGMEGITAAFAGMCECGSSTFALLGDPDAIADAAVALEATMGEKSIIGFQPVR